MILKLLLNVPMIWMMFIKILVSTIEEKNVFIVFDDMIAHMVHNRKRNPIVNELFIRGRKLSISLVFIMQSYFKVPKDVRLNPKQDFVMKIPSKRELQQIAIIRSLDIFKGFIQLYKKCNAYSFLVNNTILPSDDPLRFRKTFQKEYIIIMSINEKLKMKNFS